MKKIVNGELVDTPEAEELELQSRQAPTLGYRELRRLAYGSIGDQLDMLYKELDLLYIQLAAAGVDLNPGPFYTHIQQVKTKIPKI